MNDQEQGEAKLVIDLTKWKTRQRVEWEALNVGTVSAMIDFAIATKIVKEWGYAGDPSDREAWLELEETEVGRIFAEINAASLKRFLPSKQSSVPSA